jgi:hypothetical protein
LLDFALDVTDDPFGRVAARERSFPVVLTDRSYG